MLCSHCGKENKDGLNFCVQCGQPLVQEEPYIDDTQWIPPVMNTDYPNGGNSGTQWPTEPSMSAGPSMSTNASVNKKIIGFLAGGVAVVLLIVTVVFLDPLHIFKKKETDPSGNNQNPNPQGLFAGNKKSLRKDQKPSTTEEIIFAGQNREESQKQQNQSDQESPEQTRGKEIRPKQNTQEQVPQQSAIIPLPETPEGPLPLDKILARSPWLLGPHYDGSFLHFIFYPDYMVEVTVAYRDFGQYDTGNPSWDDPAWTKNVPMIWTYGIDGDDLLLYMEGNVYWGRLSFVIEDNEIQMVYDENGTVLPFISDLDY